MRRTIYIELRPAAGIVESQAQSKRWEELRQRWMALIVRRADPGDWPIAWNEDLPTETGSDEEEVEAILAHHEPPIPAVYCPHEIPHSVETDDYPVPADLRD